MQSFLEGNVTARQELEEQSKQGNQFADLMLAYALRHGYPGIKVDVTQAETHQRKATVARPWIDRFADTDNDYAVLWKAMRLE
jgi:hypothetical protein